MTAQIPAKANRVLNLILLCLILILIRVWYLSVVQHDRYVEQARRPQRKVVIEPAPRATISDRFGVPLAINKIQYNAAVCYAHIRDIPSVQWIRDEKGKAKKVLARSEHITSLAKMLSAELNLDPQKVEDMIHGKASLFPHTPFAVKEDITEEQYYRLRMLEKDWIGLHMQKKARRFYPQGKVACDILGYLGPISEQKYLKLSEEMQELEEYLVARDQNENPFLPLGFENPLQVRKRFEELQEMSYTINDLIGKMGVEASYEEELRGFYGKKIYEVDVKGNFLRELPISKPPINGKHLTLSVSAELQKTAEELLAAFEGPGSPEKQERWIRGCAAIAMIPQTGEIVAMASYPRFDPNDFIPSYEPTEKKEKEMAVQQWLETEGYIADIWDGKRPIEKEYYSFLTGKYEKVSVPLTWDYFLKTILSTNGTLHGLMRRISTLQEAWNPDRYLEMISDESEKNLLMDLSRLPVDPRALSHELRMEIGSMPIQEYHLQRQAVMRLEQTIKAEVQELFYDTDFKAWRANSFKDYLRRKRKEEKQQKKYPRPYTEYLDQAEKTLFSAFWDTYKPIFLYSAIAHTSPIDLKDYPQLSHYFSCLMRKAHDPALHDVEHFLATHTPMLGLEFIKSMRSYHELTGPLLSHYPRLRKGGIQKNLAAAFYPLASYGYGRSVAFRQLSAPGSVFKVVTSYQAMLERYQMGKHDLNPLTIIDDLHGDRKTSFPTQVLGYTLDGRPITRSYKGGYLPRSSHSGFGKIDILGALEQSSNVYFALVAGEHLQEPMNLAKAARQFGYGEKTGIDLPGEVAGSVPDDLNFNKTGTYSFAIGHHTFDVTPLQITQMASFIANQGTTYKPRIIKSLSGEQKGRDEDRLEGASSFRFQEPLSLVGIDFPLFTQSENFSTAHAEENPLSSKRTIPFPDPVYEMLTEGMRRSVQGSRGTARPAAMRNYMEHPMAVRDYYSLSKDILVKTGTAQVYYKETIDPSSKAVMKSNTSFAAIAYPPKTTVWENPELVVVVSIRHGHAGSDGGPIAAEIIKKWRELKQKYGEK
ncbi:MAG: hypothetical protein JSR58_02450 [Verrucomicrobia bacterium]|nr:hypothetical protein [Verrucomicrobiota bacterium]